MKWVRNTLLMALNLPHKVPIFLHVQTTWNTMSADTLEGSRAVAAAAMGTQNQVPGIDG